MTSVPVLLVFIVCGWFNVVTTKSVEYPKDAVEPSAVGVPQTVVVAKDALSDDDMYEKISDTLDKLTASVHDIKKEIARGEWRKKVEEEDQEPETQDSSENLDSDGTFHPSPFKSESDDLVEEEDEALEAEDLSSPSVSFDDLNDLGKQLGSLENLGYPQNDNSQADKERMDDLSSKAKDQDHGEPEVPKKTDAEDLVMKDSKKIIPTKDKRRKNSIEKDSVKNVPIKVIFVKKDTFKKETMIERPAKKDFVKKDIVKNDHIEKDFMEKDFVVKDSVKRDSIKKDSLKKDPVQVDSIQNHSIKKDYIQKNSVQKDSTKKDSLDKEYINKDFVTKDSMKEDIVTKDSTKKEFATKGSIRKDSIEKEAIDTYPEKDDITKKGNLQDDNTEKKLTTRSDDDQKKEPLSKDNSADKDSIATEAEKKDLPAEQEDTSLFNDPDEQEKLSSDELKAEMELVKDEVRKIHEDFQQVRRSYLGAELDEKTKERLQDMRDNIAAAKEGLKDVLKEFKSRKDTGTKMGKVKDVLDEAGSTVKELRAIPTKQKDEKKDEVKDVKKEEEEEEEEEGEEDDGQMKMDPQIMYDETFKDRDHNQEDSFEDTDVEEEEVDDENESFIQDLDLNFK